MTKTKISPTFIPPKLEYQADVFPWLEKENKNTLYKPAIKDNKNKIGTWTKEKFRRLTTINNSEKKLKEGGKPILETQRKNQKKVKTGKKNPEPRSKKKSPRSQKFIIYI